MAQSKIVEGLLKKEYPDISVVIVKIVTIGDQSETRGKPPGEPGVYTSRIEEQLVDGRIDIAVHSMKDVPVEMDDRFTYTVVKRGDPRDAIVTKTGLLLSDLPSGAKVGTHSPRRTAQILRMRPDLEIVPISGNVDTRIARLNKGEVDALVLSAAGLIRLGYKHKICYSLNPAKVPPAAGQGAICIEYLKINKKVAEVVSRVADQDTQVSVVAERAFYNRLGATCHTPVGAFGYVDTGVLKLTAGIYSENGQKGLIESTEGPASDPVSLGRQLAELVLARGGGILPKNFLE